MISVTILYSSMLLPSGNSRLVFCETLAYPFPISPVITWVPHTGTCASEVKTTCTFL